MAEKGEHSKPHFILNNTSATDNFRRVSGRGEGVKLPNLDRNVHGNDLLRQLTSTDLSLQAAVTSQREAGITSGLGIQIEFKSQEDIPLAFEQLADQRQGIELLNVRHEGANTFATVFIPEGRLARFERILTDYLTDRKGRNNQSLDHKALVLTIKEIRSATFDALWTDDIAVLPKSSDEDIWWEIWLRVGEDRKTIREQFQKIAEGMGFKISDRVLNFPERTVLLLFGSKMRITQSLILLNNVAQIRRAKETAEFFDRLSNEEQHEWIEEFRKRITFKTGEAVHICLLDSGINHGHPLLAPCLNQADLHSIEPAWGVADSLGHGTWMAGVMIYGDLTDQLASNNNIEMDFRLESVKILQKGQSNKVQHYGAITREAVARPEISAPNRRRLFCMPISSYDGRDRGRPSAWSAAVDDLAANSDAQGVDRRLIIIAGGNTDPAHWSNYPYSNATDGIHDPGQAWNALTVGAYTNKVTITDPDTEGFRPVAQAGGLSPFSTTSLTWKDVWPLKPEVVFEGGNLGIDDSQYSSTFPSLSCLTTNDNFTQKLLTPFEMTSAASALATNFSAKLMNAYPTLWPETVRGLIVHSATWTNEMKRQFLPNDPKKKDYMNLIRHCGFGVPDLEKALWSVSNSLCLIIQDEFQPFQRKGSSEPTAKEMHLHNLPWPKEILESLGNNEVQLRVTLSYFVEPNPGVEEKGIKGRYRYESHGLRFDVKRPTERDINEFRRRINHLARLEEEGENSDHGSDANWIIGSQIRHLGSIHSDIWSGTAADLAARGILAVYPTMGWWKTAKKLQKYESKARYALLISIEAPKADVDLYGAIETEIANQTVITLENAV